MGDQGPHNLKRVLADIIRCDLTLFITPRLTFSKYMAKQLLMPSPTCGRPMRVNASTAQSIHSGSS